MGKIWKTHEELLEDHLRLCAEFEELKAKFCDHVHSTNLEGMNTSKPYVSTSFAPYIGVQDGTKV
jgi:hypothetical protein